MCVYDTKPLIGFLPKNTNTSLSEANSILTKITNLQCKKEKWMYLMKFFIFIPAAIKLI